MAFIPIPEGALAVVEWGSLGQQWTTTMTFTNPAFGTADMVDLADSIHNTIGINFMLHIANIWSIRQVKVYDMRVADGELVYDQVAPVAGSEASAPASLTVALVMSFYTAGRGRSARGRNYIAGFGEADVSEYQVNNAAVVSQAEVTWQGIRSAALGLGWTQVIAQRYAAGEALEVAVTRPVISNLVRSAVFGSQRRRVNRP